MSPEQLNGQAATSASDLYSLGVVAYLCIAGRTPFAGGESMAVALAHVREAVPPLPDQVPAAVRDVVYQLLDKDPARRPESAEALAITAAPLSKQPADVAVPSKATVAPAPGTPTDSTTAGELGRLPTRRSATATGAVTRVAATPLGREESLGAGATVAFPEPGLPDRREPHQGSRPGARRSSRKGPRWGSIAVLVGIAVLAVVVGLLASAGPSTATVPGVQRSTVSNAVSVITRAGLRVSRHLVDGDEPPGRVVTQAPRGKTRVNAGSTVTLGVSSGYVDLPSANLIGQAYAPVAASISALGLRPSRQDTVSSSQAGRVLAVTPGGRVQVGATIAVSVSVAPPPTTTVPTSPTTPKTTPTSPTTPDKHGQDGNSGQSHGGD
jgi:serine/threonine-protein kinase